jgi:dTDP-4-dehydrorhamnose 3,5-epimerase
VNFQALPIRGAYIVEMERHGDERGFFARAYCQTEFAAQKLTPSFVQANNSVSAQAGTLRGLHYQLGQYAEDKLIRCIRGAVFDVVVDLRLESPTFLSHHTLQISSVDKNAVYVPRGCANGIMTLADDTELFYLVSNAYEPKAERGLRWNDPRLNIEWPGEPVVLSEKDASHPDFDAAYHLASAFGPFR